jgi:hypothetical protein
MVHSVCPEPAPGQASCLALGLEPKTAATQAHIHRLTSTGKAHSIPEASECAAHYPSSCLAPEELRSAYFPGQAPQAPASEPQTIALVDAYNDPNAQADLSLYSEEFDLPACTTANGCFKQVGEDGSETDLPFPRSETELDEFATGDRRRRERAEAAEGWALEITTDIEVAHAICQNCHIVLVEASGPGYSELEAAEDTAVALSATEISNSWGGPESGTDSPAFDHPGIAITAAAGDNGYLNWDQYSTREEEGTSYFEGADYPASSPNVISVGGTRLSLTPAGAWASESPWNSEGAGGSGCSAFLTAPTWQRQVKDWAQVGCGNHRSSTDISADADPTTGVNVYDSTPYPYEVEGTKFRVAPGWAPIGGTSVASPIIAAMVALAGGAHGVPYPAQTLYAHLGASSLHDVSTGGNGECDGDYSSCSGSLSSPLDCGPGAWVCNATIGYDGPTGVGTPSGIGAFEPIPTPAKGSEGGEPKDGPPEETGKLQGSGSEVGGSNGNQGSGTPPTGGSSSTSTGRPPGSTSSRPQASGSKTKAPPRISTLALTSRARAALRRGHPRFAQLAFSLRLTQATILHVTLTARVGSRGKARWRALPISLVFAAVKGLNSRRLHGAGRLAPGVYRLTFTPSGGTSRSITIRIS